MILDPSSGGETLSVRDAYRLWAPTFEREQAVSRIENRVVSAVTPALAGRVLLDAGCGTGRRLRSAANGARLAVGVDLVPEMLAAGKTREENGATVLTADVLALPFRGGVFDVVWMRLVIGYVEELEAAYLELARVTRAGCRLVVSDFHPDAIAAGHRRTFRDGEGRVHAIAHNVHSPTAHRIAAAQAGWTVERALDVPAGAEDRPFYERAGRLDQLERERHLPLVLVLCLGR